MLAIQIGDLGEIHARLEAIDKSLFEDVLQPALMEMGALALFEAEVHCPVLMGDLKASIHLDYPVRNEPLYGRASLDLVADADHAIYVEMGFRPHFVPFHLSKSMQEFARRILHWQFAVLPASQAGSGKVYMRDGEGNLHWGLAVSGKAQPFMAPAKVRAELVGPQIVAEHLSHVLS